MTRITKIVMNGFKSFGKRTEILFDDKFNVVLGPNGSGKSNVLDAICFVLGKSSAKSLRAEKSSNLIYNGGKSKKPAKFGEVSIYFDNKAKVFPSEEEQIKVSRIVKANGQSLYKINDEGRTRQQVLDLLSLAKINPDGYNIILQGDIVRLVEMSPVERRGIIEEIAGISIYEDKKLKAMNELAKVDVKLGEAEIIMKERKAYLKELKKDRDQAMKYKELNDKIRQNKGSFLKHQINRKVEAGDKLQEKIDKETEQLAKLQEKVRKYREDVQKKKDEIKKIDEEIERKGEKEQIDLQKQLEHLRVTVATNKTRISSCESEVHKAKLRRQQLSKNLEDLDEKVTDLKAKKQELDKAQKERLKLKDEIDSKLVVFKKKHHLDKEGGLEVDIEKLDKEIEAREQEVHQLREKQQELLREKDKIEFQIQTVDERMQKVQELEKSHAVELQALKKRKDEFKKLTLELNKYLTEDSTMAGKIADARTEVYAKREELSKFEARNAHVQEALSGNIAVKKINENKSKLGGVYGSVAELGEVKTKYAVALEVAAGPRIKSLVVEDDGVAARCIRFLKENKFGTASFLPLNKIRGATPDPKLKESLGKPGVHGLATDLVKFDPQYKEVFKYVFGNTLVVDDIEVARKIGIGTARMVTIDGDLAETAGVMIGGYRQKTGAGFKDKDLSGSIDKLNEELRDLQDSIESWEKRRAGNEETIVQLREQKANLEGEIIKTEKSLHLESSDLEASKAFKKELVESLGASEKQIEELMSKLSGMNKELANSKIKKQSLKTQMQELKSPTVLAELHAYEQKRAELNEELIHLAADLKNIDAQMSDMVGRDRESTERIFKDLDKEVDSFTKEMEQLHDGVNKAEKELKVKEEEQKKFYAKSKELYDRRNKLTDEVSSAETLTYKQEEESRQVEYKMNTVSLEQAKIKAELGALETEFEQYAGVELDMNKPEEELKKEIKEFEKMKDDVGSVNMRALEIYDSVEKEYNSLLEKVDILHKEKGEVMMLMQEIELKKKDLFMENLERTNKNFQATFQELSYKGNEASLVLENEEDPFAGGMLINVRMPNNKTLDIRSLSGGEKTMTALAFLFAIQEHEPASFYVLDEVDAALDKKNSEKLAKLVRKYCDKAQYVVISHNDAVITEGDCLYGVSMDEHGASKVVSLKV